MASYESYIDVYIQAVFRSTNTNCMLVCLGFIFGFVVSRSCRMSNAKVLSM